eukprot:scaffold43090_cov67-Phaeocystis_antarctica.AAC.2
MGGAGGSLRHRYTSVRFCRDMSPRYPTRKVLDVKPLPSSRTASLISEPRIRASPLPVCCMKTTWPLAARMLAVVLAAARMLTVVLTAATTSQYVAGFGRIRGRCPLAGMSAVLARSFGFQFREAFVAGWSELLEPPARTL